MITTNAMVILLIFALGRGIGTGVTIEAIPYSDTAGCEVARIELLAQMRNSQINVDAVCIPGNLSMFVPSGAPINVRQLYKLFAEDTAKLKAAGFSQAEILNWLATKIDELPDDE